MLRPQKRTDATMDGGDFHDVLRVRNRLIRTWILMLAGVALLASSPALGNEKPAPPPVQ